MHPRRRLSALVLGLLILSALIPTPPGASAQTAGVLSGVSPFGMNLYATGLERSDAERQVVIARAREAGVQWSREELSWANIQPGATTYNWSAYDQRLGELQAAGIKVVGMLLTTPTWASGHSHKENNWYWYPPRDPAAYGAFVEAAVRRWHDKVAVWELWNEPNAAGTWQPHADPGAYAALLAAGYAAVKRVDPNAVVMVGSVYVHDANNEGLAFLDQVVAASGGALNFDILGIHTYMPDRQPEDTSPVTVVQNLPYRMQQARAWLTRHGRPSMPIWVTEDGSSVCSCGAFGTTEQHQAERLVREYMLILANGGAQFDYFQMKDKFNNGPGDVWGNMSLLRNDLSPRPAFTAYKTMAHVLADAQFAGPGDLLRAVPNRWQPQFDRYDYRFTTPGGTVHVLWVPENVAPQAADLHISTPSAQIVQIDGSATTVTADGNGQIPVQLTSSPIFVVEQAPPPVPGLDAALDPASPTGFRVSTRFQDFWTAHGGLAAFGWPITGERQERSPTDGKLYIVQWFERTRFEWHPENPAPFTVLLGLMGRQATAGRTFPTVAPFADTPARRYVPETGHSLGGRFLQYWQSTGGLDLYGYPISEEFQERSPIDGKLYTVQYFERARFELHPANAPPFDVLLGLLGRQLLH